MFPLSLHLGSIKVSATDCGIELNATTSIELSSSMPLDRVRNGSRAIDLLTARELWVERGVGCHLAVQLRVNGERPQDEVWRADTAEKLGQVLREAEVFLNNLAGTIPRLMDCQLWEQLQLHVSLSIPSSPTSSPDIDQEDITIHIKGPQRTPGASDDPQSATLGHRYVCQARPPDGFAYAGINTIRMKLDFSRTGVVPRGKRPKLNTGLGLSRTDGGGESTASFDHVRSHLLRWRSSIREGGVSDRRFCSILAQLETLAAAAGTVIAPSQGIDTEPAGLQTRPSHTDRQATEAQDWTPASSGDGSSSPLKRACTDDNHSGHPNRQERPLTADLNLQTAVALTDAAFRSLISYRPNCYHASLKVCRESSAPSLSAIAPALWSPGHLQVGACLISSQGHVGNKQME